MRIDEEEEPSIFCVSKEGNKQRKVKWESAELSMKKKKLKNILER